MKYLALLRGINVGGNTMIKMAELKKVFEKTGCEKVITVINSGNVIFDSDKSAKTLVGLLEHAIAFAFHFDVKVVILSHEQMKQVMANIPPEWKKPNDLRCYVAFVKAPTTPQDVINEVNLTEGVDSIKTGKQAAYMSTKLSGLTKSGYTKLASKKIYRDITIRNYHTTQKLLALMEQM